MQNSKLNIIQSTFLYNLTSFFKAVNQPIWHISAGQQDSTLHFGFFEWLREVVNRLWNHSLTVHSSAGSLAAHSAVKTSARSFRLWECCICILRKWNITTVCRHILLFLQSVWSLLTDTTVFGGKEPFKETEKTTALTPHMTK